MVNKIVLLTKIVWFGPPLGHCRGPLYEIVWQPVFTTALTRYKFQPQFQQQSPPQSLLQFQPQSPPKIAIDQMEVQHANGRQAEVPDAGIVPVEVSGERVGEVVTPVRFTRRGFGVK